MAAIAAQVGGSRTTLYSNFKSKEELFAAVMTDAVEEQAARMMALLDPAATDLRAALQQFGSAYLDLVLSPDVLALSRLGMAEGAHGRLGPALYLAGPGRGWAQMTAQLARWIEEGRLNITEPDTAALRLKGLLEAGMLEPALYGADPARARDAAVNSAVDAFLRAYPLSIGGSKSAG